MTLSTPPVSGMLRVGAAQFFAGSNVSENLASCVRLIGQAAAEGVQVLVLPEFSNHAAWYDDADHAWDVAVDVDGEFVRTCGEAAAVGSMYVQLNVSVRTTSTRGGPLTSSNLLLGPTGSVVGRSDKCVLMGNENTYFVRATSPNPVLDLPFGRVGMYACMEGVIAEPPRSLAVRGAQLLLNSLNSFALDEASLHIPVRAPENAVWVVAANKCGPIVPIEKISMVAAMLKVPESALHGGGEAQIVAPDGRVVAKAPHDGEHLVISDIDLALAENKLRPDGTDRIAMRRPSLYASLQTEPPAGGIEHSFASDTLVVASIAQELTVASRAQAAVADAVAQRCRLIVLPELLGLHDQRNVELVDWPAVVAAVASVCDQSFVVTSIAEGGANVGVLISSEGIVGRQPMLHRSHRHGGWLSGELGPGLTAFDLPFGRVVIIVGDDLIVPEVGRMAAIIGAHIIAAPITISEPWEESLGLVERSAENRVSLVAASAAVGFGGGLITSLPRELTLWSERPERAFDGRINVPDLFPVPPGSILVATIQPANATNKMISRNTDLVNGRPWQAMLPLVNA